MSRAFVSLCLVVLLLLYCCVLRQSAPVEYGPDDVISEPAEAQNGSVVSAPSVESEEWLDEESAVDLLSADMLALLRGIESGQSLSVTVGENVAREYLFRPAQMTTGGFQISSSPTDVYPAQWHVYNGIEHLGDAVYGNAASLAIVNDSVSMAIELDGIRYLVETDPTDKALYAIALNAGDPQPDAPAHVCANYACSHEAGDRLAGMQAPEGLSGINQERIPVSMAIEAAEASAVDANWVDHSYFRLGPQYDASLKDILILMVSGSTQTGPSTNLSSRAASYLTYAARVADSYERQLGLRYLLQELVLIASDSGEDDIEYDDSVTPNDPDSGSDDLGALRDWCSRNRPKSEYGWGHAAGWTLVEGSSFGTIGWASVKAYGGSSSISVQERQFDWDVHSHELGHCVGAFHTDGGVMNAGLVNNNENFFAENASSGGFTGAMDIYNYMSSPSRNNVFGPAELRNPEEIPFAIDDLVSTAASTVVTFDPLANDATSVLFGATNTIRLVEVGQVFPKAAGVAEVVGNEIRFTPTIGFSGNVWFSYTIAGDVGNSGNGWLHAADVIVTVGGASSDPSLTPAMNLTADSVETDFSAPIRINPLLNDEGSGRLWAGDVDVLSDIDGMAESYSEASFELLDATILVGNGTLDLEVRSMTRNGLTSSGNTGYLVYTPATNELDEVTIEYIVEDANGTRSSTTVTLQRVATVSVSIDRNQLVEDQGQVACVEFTRESLADSSVGETIHFSLGGSAVIANGDVDVLFSGEGVINSDGESGSITIPAGEFSASLFIVAANDGDLEGEEDLTLSITQTESLLIGPVCEVSLTLQDSFTDAIPLWIEDFDSFIEPSGIGSGAGEQWTNVVGEASLETDWEVESGTTRSSNTGPSGDYTTGSGNYLYIEASSRSNYSAELISPSYDLSKHDTPRLRFAYHMYGSNMGELHVDVRMNSGEWVLDVLPVLDGQQSVDSNDWKVANIDVSAYRSTATQFRFRGVIGSGFRSDICIDDFLVYKPLVTEVPVIFEQPESVRFDLGDPLVLTVTASGLPVPAYQWKKDGAAINGANTATYSILSADYRDAGAYTCEVSNTAGTVVTNEAILSLNAGSLNYDSEWIDSAFGEGHSEDDIDLYSDYNNDGRENIIDYAFQIFPINPNDAAGKLPSFSMIAESSEVYAAIRFRRIEGGAGDIVTEAGYSAAGVLYQVETIAQLDAQSWESGTDLLEEVGSPISNGDGTETVTVRLKAEQDEINNPSAFLRITIEEAP